MLKNQFELIIFDWENTLGNFRMPIFEDVFDMLSDLKEKGFSLAIATGKSQSGLNEVLHQTGIKHFFSAVACAENYFPKPNPAMLNAIIEDLGYQPEKAVMVGDTSYDLEMAAKIGMPSIAVTYGAHSKKTLEALFPLFLAESIETLHAKLIEYKPDT